MEGLERPPAGEPDGRPKDRGAGAGCQLAYQAFSCLREAIPDVEVVGRVALGEARVDAGEDHRVADQVPGDVVLRQPVVQPRLLVGSQSGAVLCEARIAVTPIQLDLTARRLLKRLSSWSWELPDKPPRADDARHNKG